MPKGENINSKKNLIPMNKRPEAERTPLLRKAAETMNRKIREKKTFQVIIQSILDSKIDDKSLQKIKLKHPDLKQDITYRELMVLAQVKKSILESDTKAFEVVRDTGGEIIKRDEIQPNNNFYINIVKNEVK